MSSTISERPGLLGATARFWQRSYVSDYIGFVLLQVALIIIEIFVEPFHRMFSLDDKSKQYPHALVERVSPTQNILYAGIGPLCLFVLWAIIFRPGFHKAHVTILGLFISITLTSLLTDIIKNAVGRPRPDLIDRCKPQPGTSEHVLITIAVCTETDHHTLHDGWRSFPSGHSSFAFSGLGYLTLFLAGQFRVFRPRTGLVAAILVVIPLVGAGLIAMSRLADYRHDVFDVTCGSALGMAVAYFSYRRYYPPLTCSRCDEPHPSPADYARTRGLGKSRAKDIEEQQRISNAEDFELEELASDEEENRPLNNGKSRDRSKQQDHG